MSPLLRGDIFKRKMRKEIISKYFNNRCTNEELEEVIRWVEKSALEKESQALAYNEWKSFHTDDNKGDDEKFSNIFDKIQQRIDNNVYEYKKASTSRLTLPLLTTWLTRVAAVLLIPVLAFLFYTLAQKNTEVNEFANTVTDSLEIVAPIGSRTIVQLSDGTEVHLNYGSKIKYPQKFSGNTREVILSGEGYFDVTHNPDKPFIVKTAKLNVKVLGTSFNVMAYPNNDEIETTLVKGKIILEQNEGEAQTRTLGSMIPGQHVRCNLKTGEVYSSQGNIEKYTSWKDGKLIFEDAPITQVTEKLSRMFNVDIEVSDDIKDYIYTVTFIDEPLFQILDLMTIATPVRYTALPRKKLPDGTFSKQKIIIKRNIK